jgi:hypothetical protein
MGMNRRLVLAATAVIAAAVGPGQSNAVAAVTAVPASASVQGTPVVRVNQVGYPNDATKVAYAMLPHCVTGLPSTAKGDPFGLGTALGDSDASPHAFGLYITDALYREYGGSGAYQAFAQQQLNFALGANAWGSSFVVGAGSTFPHCMQSEIANLEGALTGHGSIQVGATSDGPSSTPNFTGLGTVQGMRACGSGNYGAFDTPAVSYEDNVVSWPSVEPADDYSVASLYAFALGAAGLG